MRPSEGSQPRGASILRRHERQNLHCQRIFLAGRWSLRDRKFLLLSSSPPGVLTSQPRTFTPSGLGARLISLSTPVPAGLRPATGYLAASFHRKIYSDTGDLASARAQKPHQRTRGSSGDVRAKGDAPLFYFAARGHVIDRSRKFNAQRTSHVSLTSTTDISTGC